MQIIFFIINSIMLIFFILQIFILNKHAKELETLFNLLKDEVHEKQVVMNIIKEYQSKQEEKSDNDTQ